MINPRLYPNHFWYENYSNENYDITVGLAIALAEEDRRNNVPDSGRWGFSEASMILAKRTVFLCGIRHPMPKLIELARSL